MASLSVRRIEPHVYERLRVRAALHGVSMEEEVRRILGRSVAPERLGEFALKCFGNTHRVTLEFDRDPHEPLELEP
jgi:antitoxin FitA